MNMVAEPEIDLAGTSAEDPRGRDPVFASRLRSVCGPAWREPPQSDWVDPRTARWADPAVHDGELTTW